MQCKGNSKFSFYKIFYIYIYFFLQFHHNFFNEVLHSVLILKKTLPKYPTMQIWLNVYSIPFFINYLGQYGMSAQILLTIW